MPRRAKYKITKARKGTSRELFIGKGLLGRGKTGGKWGMEIEGGEYRDVPYTRLTFERQFKRVWRGNETYVTFKKSRVKQNPEAGNPYGGLRGLFKIRRK